VRTVGKRRDAGDAFRDQGRLARTMAFLRGTRRIARRGVYRFSSFEEAEAWLIREMIETRVRRPRE
jgi:hypothetical protein